MTAVAAALAGEFPSTNKGWSVHLEPLHDVLIGGDLRLTSLLFLGVVGFVLLICCANVANLLMARAAGRARELAIRSALGAGRRRIVRQLLTESLVLAALGGALGIAVGAAILRVTPSVIPDGLLPDAVVPAFDMRVGAFCAVVALVLGVVFGLAPAWHTRGVASSAAAMSGDTRTTTTRGGGIRALLVVGEVAAAVLLLVGAGLLLRTLLAVDHVPRGYAAESVLAVFVDPLGGRYPNKESLLQFFDSVERETSADISVRSTAWASTLPLGESTFGSASFEIVGDPPVDENRKPTANYQIVSPSYFTTLELPVVAGRAFRAADTTDGAPVAIVNEAFVRRHLGGRSVVGARVAVRSPISGLIQAREIVGVARQVKGRPDEAEEFVQLYVPIAQDPSDDIFLLVRPKVGSAASLAPSVRAEAAARDLLVVDATCPLVAKVHNEVRRYAGRGDTVLLIGHGDHEEVEGTVGEAPSRVVVVEDARAAASVAVEDPRRVAYTMQTTLAVDEAEEIASVLRERFPAIQSPRRDDICYATTNRQQAVRTIARGCDLLLVVGSANSSNSLRLVEVAQREGTRAVLVDDVGEVDLKLLAGAGRVGITAGASAPPHLVDELVSCLTGLGPVTVHHSPAPPEDIHFTLPREVS